MSKTISWLIVVCGVIISILAEGYFYDIPAFVANAAVGVGILGTMGYINKKK